MLAVTVGVLLFVFSWQNRVSGQSQKIGALLCALAAGVMLTLYSDFLTEFTYPNQQHSGEFYRISSAVFPMVLVLTARASRLRWPATIAAATYMTALMLMIWILPLFPAQPKLAPIYNPVTHMVPPPFPLLLILPALGIDLLMQAVRRGSRALGFLRSSDALLAGGVAAVFLGIFVPVQWFFSIFLLSDAADNWVFARSGHWPYFVQVGPHMNHFWDARMGTLSAWDLAVAFVVALVASAVGLWCGNYLLKVRR